jgi:Ca-activated chloride channel family protein
MPDLGLLHFLRPWWLVAVPLALLAWWLVRRRVTKDTPGANLIAPHLREALTVNQEERRRFLAVDGVAVAMLATALAAAGPTWSKQPSPWFSETAPLVIAIEVTDSMRSNDLQPTRLDRARFKVLELIERRTGSRTAIVAYAGSAHIVMPPSKDLEVVKPFLESLDPRIMPKSGANAAAVLPLSQELLAEQAVVGTLLFVNDGFDSLDVPLLAEYSRRPDATPMVALVVGTDEGGVALMPDGSPVITQTGRIDTSIDSGVLDRVQSEAGMPVIRATNDDADVRTLIRRIESNLAEADDPNAQWLDQAWWFTLPAAFVSLLWFRRGWTMKW